MVLVHGYPDNRSEWRPIAERLAAGQLDREAGGVGGIVDRLDRILVHIGDMDGEGHAGVFQHGAAGGALGRQNQGLGRHQLVPILWVRCSLSRLVMAAAVSSTERRVTSMVGQPRRAKARLALIVSSRTASWSV